jgi:glucose/arabinose dehydrogenase
MRRESNSSLTGVRGSVAAAALLSVAVIGTHLAPVHAVGQTVVDPNLTVETVVTGLTQPIGMAFLGRNDLLVLEKGSGKVQRVINGVVQITPALDLAVNSASERPGRTTAGCR